MSIKYNKKIKILWRDKVYDAYDNVTYADSEELVGYATKHYMVDYASGWTNEYTPNCSNGWWIDKDSVKVIPSEIKYKN